MIVLAMQYVCVSYIAFRLTAWLLRREKAIWLQGGILLVVVFGTMVPSWQVTVLAVIVGHVCATAFHTRFVQNNRLLKEGVVVQALLTQERIIVVPARQGRRDPNEFFQTSDVMSVRIDFDTLQAKPIGSAPEMQLAIFSLTYKATNAEIQTELPEGYAFEDRDIDTLFYHLAVMIEDQDEVVVNNGRPCVFYTRSGEEIATIFVHWDVAYERWSVDVPSYPIVVHEWSVGTHVFSATAGRLAT